MFSWVLSALYIWKPQIVVVFPVHAPHSKQYFLRPWGRRRDIYETRKLWTNIEDGRIKFDIFTCIAVSQLLLFVYLYLRFYSSKSRFLTMFRVNMSLSPRTTDKSSLSSPSDQHSLKENVHVIAKNDDTTMQRPIHIYYTMSNKLTRTHLKGWFTTFYCSVEKNNFHFSEAPLFINRVVPDGCIFPTQFSQKSICLPFSFFEGKRKSVCTFGVYGFLVSKFFNCMCIYKAVDKGERKIIFFVEIKG